MTVHTDELLEKLAKDYVAYLSDPLGVGFLDFRHTYFKAIALNFKELEVEQMQCLLAFTEKFNTACMELTEIMPFEVSNKAMALLNHGENLDYFLADPAKHKTLYWMLLDHASTYLYWNSEHNEADTKAILLKMTGKTVDADVKPGLDVTTSTLFGPAVWELYGCPLSTSIYETQLCELMVNLIHVGSAVRGRTPTATAELPVDFT